MQEQQFTRVAITLSDGQLALMSFCTRGRGSVLPEGAQWAEGAPGMWVREPSNENLFSEICRTFCDPKYPQAVKYRVLGTDEQVPRDRTYRNALRDTGAELVHDMPRARALHLERVRRKRAVDLAALDIEYMRHVGINPKRAAEVETQRQALRDLPTTLAPALEAASTVEQLKGVQP